MSERGEPVKPEPWQVFAEKSGELTGQAAADKGAVKAGIMSAGEYEARSRWAEEELLTAWREYVASIP